MTIEILTPDAPQPILVEIGSQQTPAAWSALPDKSTAPLPTDNTALAAALAAKAPLASPSFAGVVTSAGNISTTGANANIQALGGGNVETALGQFIGAGTGLTGTGAGFTAGEVTSIGNLTGVVTSTNRVTSIANGAITNVMIANSAVANLSGTNTGDQTSVTGNAGTATAAQGIKTATTTVSVSTAAAPSSGQQLIATSPTTATWQTPSSGGASTWASLTDKTTAPLTTDNTDLSNALTENWVIKGDSWTQDYAPANQKTWPFYIAKIARKGVNIVNAATAGQSALQMVGTFSAQITPYLTTASGRKSIFFLFAGINDVYTNDATAVQNCRDNLRSMWTSARAQGALVCAFTIPHRLNGNGGWTQANWRALNAQIIADASYYDYLVRTDIAFSNAASTEYTDGIHISTEAHKKLASRVFGLLNGREVTPSLWPRAAFYSSNGTALTAGVVNYMGFQNSLFIDNNNDVSTVTVGGLDVKTFTVPVDGTYVADGNFLAANTTGATLIFSVYVTPLATGVPEEYRLQYVISAASFYSLSGTTGPLKLKLGDTIKIGVNPSIAGVACLSNARFSLFSVSLISIP